MREGMKEIDQAWDAKVMAQLTPETRVFVIPTVTVNDGENARSS